MQTVLDIVNFIAANAGAIIAGVLGLFTSALAIALIVPGSQPDKFLQSVVDFISKFSRK
jgi:hypothetical protein